MIPDHNPVKVFIVDRQAPGILTFGVGSTTVRCINNRVATVGDEAVSDNDKSPTDILKAQAENQGQKRFRALLEELRTLLSEPTAEPHSQNLDVETEHG